MARSLILKKTEDDKKILKIEIGKKSYDEIEKIKDDLKNIDHTMSFNLEGVIESAIKRAVKAAQKEIDNLRKSNLQAPVKSMA